MPQTHSKEFKKLKLCYVADASNIHVQRWISYFAKQGHEVICLADKGGQIQGVDVIPLPNRDDLLARNEKANKTSVIKARTRKIQQIIDDFRPDVLHAIFLYQRGWSAALANFHPLVITLLGSDIFLPEKHYRSPMHLLRDKALNQGALQQADLVTAVNANLQREAQTLAGKNLPIDIISIGTDPDVFHPNPDPHKLAELRQRLNLADPNFVVLSPRQVAPIYNIDVIIRSIPKVLKAVPNAIFILKDAFSNDPARKEYVAQLQSEIKKQGLEKHVRWVDEVPYDELPLFYHLADAVVSVPSTDGMPVTLFDAMACETPVIVGDLPSYDQVITHNQSGLRVPIKNPEALADAIIRLHQEPELSPQLIKNADAILKRYGIFDDQMARMETHYQSLATQKKLNGKFSSKQFNKTLYKMLIRIF